MREEGMPPGPAAVLPILLMAAMIWGGLVEVMPSPMVVADAGCAGVMSGSDGGAAG